MDHELAGEGEHLRAKRVEGGLARDRPIADGDGVDDRRAREDIIEVTIRVSTDAWKLAASARLRVASTIAVDNSTQ